METWTTFCKEKSKDYPNCDPCAIFGDKCQAPKGKAGKPYNGPPLSGKKHELSQPEHQEPIAKAKPVKAVQPEREVDRLDAIILASSLTEIIGNEQIRNNYNLYLTTLSGARLLQEINTYQLITSDNFIKLLNSLSITKSEIKTYKDTIIGAPDFKGYYALIEILNLVKAKIERTPQNTNYKYLTDRNVQITEDIESLSITDLSSISRIFSDFHYFKKDSSSPSLVFNAKLADSGKNAVKARNTLKPGKLFFFKLFPVGEVKNVKGKKIQYPTIGLQTEITMYSELLKLVKYNITPNILCKIATSVNVTGLEEFLDNTDMLDEAKQYTFNDIINVETLGVPADTIWQHVSFISTHKGGIEIMKIFPTLEPEERRGVMFQLIYNMYVFDKLEISQGDLHGGNVLVNVLDAPVELIYIVEGTQYRVTTRHLVKYFDLDRGMIGKTTTLRINKTQTENMNNVTNPVRGPDSWVNMEYGVTSIYNKNLEFVNLITHETHGLLPPKPEPKLEKVIGTKAEQAKITKANEALIEQYEALYPPILRKRQQFRFEYPGKANDESFNTFMSNVMPGASPTQAISGQTIKDTYSELLKIPENLREANRIFGTNSPAKYGIDPDIFDMTWAQYFDYIKDKDDRLGHILKSNGVVVNNHLWVPDTVVLTKLDMLKQPYFRGYIKKQPYNITQNFVYTLDGMIQ
jgi:hypothetical protein